MRARLVPSTASILWDHWTKLFVVVVCIASCVWLAAESIDHSDEYGWVAMTLGALCFLGAILGITVLRTEWRHLAEASGTAFAASFYIWGSTLVCFDAKSGRKRRIPMQQVSLIEFTGLDPYDSFPMALRIQILGQDDVLVEATHLPETPAEIFAELKRCFAQSLVQPREDLMLLVAPRYASSVKGLLR